MSQKDVVWQEMVWHSETQSLDDHGWLPPDPAVYDHYFEVVNAAIANQIKVIGLEWCRYDGRSIIVRQRENFNIPELSQTLLREIAGETAPGGLMSERRYEIFEQHHPLRNWHAADVLAKVLADGQSKVAVFGGWKHYGYKNDLRNAYTVNGILRRLSGLSGPVVYYSVFREPKTSWSYQGSPDLPKIIFEAASGSPLAAKKFMLAMNVDGDHDIDRPDYIVHLS